MRAPISIIIPTLNAGAALATCAGSLMEAVEAGLVRELIISDGGSTDETRVIAEGLGAVLLEGPAARGGQIARGVEVASGTWLLILHADSVLAPGWSADAEAFMTRSPERAGYFRLRFDVGGPAAAWIAGWARFRARVFSLPYGDQGLLVARDLLCSVGGVPDLPLMEDVALARRLSGRFTPLSTEITTSAERYLQDGWFRRGARNLGLLARYFGGADPADLADRYRR